MKQTKSKKSMKQFLTLMLAFVMVFTGMGIGSWGVDTAWADETDLSNIKIRQANKDDDFLEISQPGTKLNYPVYMVEASEETTDIVVSGIQNVIVNNTTYD